jgi:hypothetical protein
MMRLMLAVAIYAITALTGATAAEIARKAPPKAEAVHGCWWEPPVYYRYYPDFVFYSYDDAHRRPGCRDTYYAPRWSGFSLNPWRN